MGGKAHTEHKYKELEGLELAGDKQELDPRSPLQFKDLLLSGSVVLGCLIRSTILSDTSRGNPRTKEGSGQIRTL